MKKTSRHLLRYDWARAIWVVVCPAAGWMLATLPSGRYVLKQIYKA